MPCTNPITITKNLNRATYPNGLEVGCGKCLSCRIQRRREWNLRLWHESSYHDDMSFVTLTYDKEHLPPNGCLMKHHLQNFFKRLRGDIYGKKIKHYSVGEYGDKGDRPHYHCIIFGLNDVDAIRRNWKCGNVFSGTVTPASIGYVTSYCNKKLTGGKAVETYHVQGRISPFSIQSNGLGKRYAIDNKKQTLDNGYMTMQGRKYSIPRYYLKIYGIKLKSDSTYDSKLVKKLTGLDMSREELKKIKTHVPYSYVEQEYISQNKQRDKNIKAKESIKKRKL